jgi:ABC-type lipoprotein release transport system permease subunit
MEAPCARYLLDIRDGQTLAEDDDRGALIGEKLAKRLEVRIGQKIRVMAQRADGEMGADLFRVRGIFHSISAGISEARVIITAPAAQKLLGLPDAAHQIVIQLPRAEDADSVAASLRARLGSGFDVVSYGELLPALKTMERTIDGVLTAMAIFVYLLVGLGILNTMLMSVLERTRELGVMQAVGTRPGRIRALLLAEAFWVATLSVGVGLVLGLSLNRYGAHHSLFGFLYKSVGESLQIGDATVSTAFHTQFSLAAGLRAGALVYLVTLLVGLYPAWRISRMRPADALRAS